MKIRQKINIMWATNNNILHYKTTNMHLICKNIETCKMWNICNKLF